MSIYVQVPVLESLPSPLVPVTAGSEKDAAVPAGNVVTVVASPSRVRLREDMWVSSRSFFVLDAEVRRESKIVHSYR